VSPAAALVTDIVLARREGSKTRWRGYRE